MTNKEKLALRLKDSSPNLKQEINYFLEVYEDMEDYDTSDAFDDAANLIEQNSKDKSWREVASIYIDIDYAVEVDITKIYSTHKKYWFKINGKHYECIEPWESWIKK